MPGGATTNEPVLSGALRGAHQLLWRALIVEDEPELRTILRDNLEIQGYEVLSAETGELGVEVALREHPDIVILDLTVAASEDLRRRLGNHS